MGRIRVLSLIVGAALAVAVVVTPAPPAAANPWGCQFSTPNLKWKANITNTAAYLNPAQWSATYWTRTLTPIILTQVTSGANIGIADGVFGATGFDGITLNNLQQNPFTTCSNGYWTRGIVTWWNRTYTDSYSGEKKLSVMVHELGHALGLGHESFQYCSEVQIMQPDTYTRYDRCGKYTPQGRDVAWINSIY